MSYPRGVSLDLSHDVGMAIAAIRTEFPTYYPLRLEAGPGVGRPRDLTPVFWGSFDWHSAVHGHWSLVRALRLGLAGDRAQEAREALRSSLTEEGLEAEREHLAQRPWFERPYGLAWLLQLAADLRLWDDPDARRWLASLGALEQLASERLWDHWAALPYPIRSGQHDQTAFAMGLARDWAAVTGKADLLRRLDTRARAWHEHERGAPVAFEPSGHDFLSPSLGIADLMGRCLPAPLFAHWLEAFLPPPGSEQSRHWLSPVRSPDPDDGKLAHLDGLNLSRAWMLRSLAERLATVPAASAAYAEAGRRHLEAGLAATRATRSYAGTHWLGSFAIYALTRGTDATPTL